MKIMGKYMQSNFKNMKWTCYLILCYGNLIMADYNYLPLLNQLGMSNPVIIGENSKLKSKEMFHLMKGRVGNVVADLNDLLTQ